MAIAMMASIFLTFALSLVAPPAIAQTRVALVIGNGAYVHAASLENPRNDVQDMAAALQKLGFRVVSGVDLSKADMDRTIQQFATVLTGADLGLFFYAGHGLQVDGVNYLVPVDARLSAAHALDFEMVRLDIVQRVMEHATKTNVIFLDACRDNPLARNLTRALGTRSASVGRGLAHVEAGVGTLISYATQPGAVAADGSGRNSPFTASLKSRILAEGEDLTSILIGVRNDVLSATGGKQVPWDQHALRARLFLTGRTISPQPAPTQQPPPPPVATLAPQPAAPAARQSHAAPPRSSICAQSAGGDRYCVSSQLAPQHGNTYGPGNLFDGDTRTAWVHGSSRTGVGAWVSVVLNSRRPVSAISIVNGYAKSTDIFNKNTRVRQVELIFSNGETRSLALPDDARRHTFRVVPAVEADWVQVRVADVYRGWKYVDTAITELRVD
jgi:hypothetical protein